MLHLRPSHAARQASLAQPELPSVPVSLVRDPLYYRDPASLDPTRAELRRRVVTAALRQVAHGADGRSMIACLLEGFGLRPEGHSDEADDFCVSDLPGRFVTLCEEWQGHGGSSFYVRLLYLEPDTGTACLVSADQDLEDDEPTCESIWLGLDELRAIGTVL